jgi:hypothetical protein
MKNAFSVRWLGWSLALPVSLWAFPVMAQEDIYGNAPTNNFQYQSNTFQPLSTGPTAPGSGQLSAPFLGTTALAGSLSAQTPYLPTGPGLERWGPLSVYPHLLYSFSYGNGLEAQPGINSTTAINTVAPGVLLRLGNHWILDYTPTLTFYSNPVFRDTTGQSVVLYGFTTYRDWTLSLAQSYLDTTQPLVETGTQVEQLAYSTAFNATWQMNGKMSLQLGLNQNFRFTEAFNDLHEWTTTEWLNYQFERQLGAALGVSGGYDEVSLGSDMPFEQLLGRVVFRPGAKLNLTLIGGAEERQIIHPSAPSFFSPVLNASLQYQAFEGTALAVLASRTVTPAFYGNEINVITSVTASIRQHLVGKLNFEMTGGYASEPFDSIEAGPLPAYFLGVAPRTTLAVTRLDTRTFAQCRLSMIIHTRLTASIFYMINNNASSQANFNYAGQQAGLELNYRY